MIGTILATVASFIARRAISAGGSGIVGTIMDGINKGMDGKVRLAQIDAETGQVIYTTHAEQGTERQKAKFNVPVFVAVLAMTIGAPATLFWSVTLYNIFWWSGGIWPQDWGIAEYPPSVAPWAEMAMQWLFDPIGPPAAVGTAGVAAWLTGKRR